MNMPFTMLLACLCILMTIPGCSVRQPHGGMQMRPSPRITPDHYQVFDAAGNPAAVEDIVEAAIDVDVVFVGEEHGDPAGHFLEKELLVRLAEAYGPNETSELERRVVLSMEMFERDVQTVLDEYLEDLITERHFRKAARPWPGYRTDYRPLVEFAKSTGMPVKAANAPGRYVNRVARLGRSSLAPLSPAAKAWLPPLPYGQATAAYREKFKDFWEKTAAQGQPHGPAPDPAAGDDASEAEAAAEAAEAFEKLLDAQSLWDAAMAWSISEALRQYPGALVMHVNGKFHSEYGLGIPEHLARLRPELSSMMVTMLASPAFPAFDPAAAGAGDFIIITDPSLKSPP